MQIGTLVSLYFCEGLAFSVVVAMSVVFFKNSGMDNTQVTVFSNLLALPWSLKMLWAVWIDRSSLPFKAWIVATEMVMVLLCALLAVAVYVHVNLTVILILFSIFGYLAATQDLAIDAVYLSLLDTKNQSALMWVRNSAFRLAYLLGAGILVSIAGMATENHCIDRSASGGWTVSFALTGFVMLIATVHNQTTLAKNSNVHEASKLGERTALLPALKSFIAIRGILRIVLYVLVFRIGDALLSSISQPFLLDAQSAGGLGMKTSLVGLIYGSLGAISLLGGGLVGGLCVTKYGALKLLIPFSLSQSLSILGYFYLSLLKPAVSLVLLINSFEQFTFGLTTSCYYIILLAAVEPRFRATHFAIICAWMNFGLIVPGMISGLIQQNLGYSKFFLLAFFLSLLGPCVSKLLPKHELFLPSQKI